MNRARERMVVAQSAMDSWNASDERMGMEILSEMGLALASASLW